MPNTYLITYLTRLYTVIFCKRKKKNKALSLSLQWSRSVTSCSLVRTGRSFVLTWPPSLRVRRWRLQSFASIKLWRWVREQTGRFTSPSTRSNERTDTGFCRSVWSSFKQERTALTLQCLMVIFCPSPLREPELVLLDMQSVPAGQEGWLAFDVTSASNHWLLHPRSNLGIRLYVETEEGWWTTLTSLRVMTVI